MKILLITPYIYPDLGGLETYVYELSEKLAKKHEITILSSYKNNTKAEFTQNITLKRIPYDFKISNTPVCMKLYHEITKLHEKNNYDLIISHTPVPFFADIAALFSKNHKIPHMLFYHSGTLYKKSLMDLVAWVYENTLQKLSLKSVDKIIVLNPFVKKYLKQNNIECVKMGFNLPEISATQLQKNIQSRKRQILFVGNLNKSHKWKGVDCLIKAMQIVQQTHKYELVLAGEGNYKSHYLNLAKKRNVQIRFTGRQGHEELQKVYVQSKMLILPSLSNAESFGRVIIEAAAHGVPTIASNIGGIPNVIKHNETGLLVQPDNEQKLAKAIIELIENDEKYSKLSINAYKHAQNFSWSEAIEEISTIIDDVTYHL